MRQLRSVEAVKASLRPLAAEGIRVGLVPTMGALHSGHLSLVEAVKKAGAEHVVASIFVNPKQFGPNEDLDRYPRDLEGDLLRLESVGCDAVFFPEPASMYPEGFQTTVSVSEVAKGLCGAHRPGHFDGVATVVLKLFNIVRPDYAVFGEKDFQQLTVLRALARDLNLDVEIIGAPLMRDSDGLALSSRNRMLSPEERARALSISAGLRAAEALYAGGERGAGPLLNAVRTKLAAAKLQPEYLELRGSTDLAPLRSADGPAVILVATRVGDTRLIDNLILRRP